MKKIASLVSSVGFLTIAQKAFADVTIAVVAPGGIIPATTPLGDIISNLVKIAFVVASLLVLAMLIFGGIQWIISGGDKEAVGKARSRIIAALIGLAVLALTFLIINIIGNILGIGNIFGDLRLPTLTNPVVAPTPTRAP